MTSRSFQSLLIVAAVWLLNAPVADAQEAEKPAKIFTSDAVIAATIDAPWREISRFKERDTAWPGTFSFQTASGERKTIPVSITTRGLTRKRICDFPPLRLDFDKEASKGTAFRGAGNLKMVTHCFYHNRYEDYYVKEYLGYKLYNRVTDMSFRVQGLDVNYIDGSDDRKPTERFAFLIEDPDDVAKRNDLKKLDITEANPKLLDARQTTRFMLFQYLIGNLDWSVLSGPGKRCCHNARLIGSSDSANVVYPVPYDLDSSGLADTHYAAPPKNLRVRTVKQRLFRGFCDHNDQIPATVKQYQLLRGEFEELIRSEPRLDAREKKKALDYVGDFYEVLDSEKAMDRRLSGSCRG